MSTTYMSIACLHDRDCPNPVSDIDQQVSGTATTLSSRLNWLSSSAVHSQHNYPEPYPAPELSATHAGSAPLSLPT